ncbi:hypothetical protein BT69DRAFT_1043157 [Atractiella rhizophila]|nr:hypothetical protein BT69DRAFT_1043157 [Atractiella rhizophila]
MFNFAAVSVFLSVAIAQTLHAYSPDYLEDLTGLTCHIRLYEDNRPECGNPGVSCAEVEVGKLCQPSYKCNETEIAINFPDFEIPHNNTGCTDVLWPDQGAFMIPCSGTEVRRVGSSGQNLIAQCWCDESEDNCDEETFETAYDSGTPTSLLPQSVQEEFAWTIPTTATAAPTPSSHLIPGQTCHVLQTWNYTYGADNETYHNIYDEKSCRPAYECDPEQLIIFDPNPLGVQDDFHNNTACSWMDPPRGLVLCNGLDWTLGLNPGASLKYRCFCSENNDDCSSTSTAFNDTTPNPVASSAFLWSWTSQAPVVTTAPSATIQSQSGTSGTSSSKVNVALMSAFVAIGWFMLATIIVQ